MAAALLTLPAREREAIVFPAEISGMERENTHVLSVSAAPAVVAAIEETIKRLDVPPPATRSVEVTLYVLECSVSADAGSLPQDLQSVLDASQPPLVRLRGLDLANFLGSGRSRLGGDIEVRDGQKVVLGRLGTTESGKDQIVVLTARVAP